MTTLDLTEVVYNDDTEDLLEAQIQQLAAFIPMLCGSLEGTSVGLSLELAGECQHITAEATVSLFVALSPSIALSPEVAQSKHA